MSKYLGERMNKKRSCPAAAVTQTGNPGRTKAQPAQGKERRGTQSPAGPGAERG
jgi:hypothetical protein